MKKSMNVRDMAVRDIILDMAKAFGVSYEEENNEICIDIPDKLGNGVIRAIAFEHGVGVLELDFLLKEEISFTFKKGAVQPLKILFNREGTITHKFHGKEEEQRIKHLESAILSSNSKHWHILTFPAGEPVSLVSLEINRKLFEAKIESFVEGMNEELEQLFRDLNGINLFYYKGFYTLDIAKFLEEFSECELDGFMRSVYLEGKTYEILTQQLKQYLDDLNEPNGRKILRKSTVKRIEEAVNIIKEEIENIGNVPELSKRVGLNQNTLQNGFKKLYKTSVNTFITDYRITRSKDLIENTDLNITEISYKIGISSRSYFSKLFKEKFGITPKQYLDRTRNTS